MFDGVNRLYKVFARTDDRGRVVAINSSAFLANVGGWVHIDSGSGDKYHHAQGNYLSGPLYDNYGVPRYIIVDGAIVERPAADLIADRPEPLPSQPDKIDQCIDMCRQLQDTIDKIKIILKIP